MTEPVPPDNVRQLPERQQDVPERLTVLGYAPKLSAALAKFQAQLPHIAKGATAQIRSEKGAYSYDYADLEAVSSQVMPLLGQNGLAFASFPTIYGGRFALIYSLLHESGERLDGVYPLSGTGSPQQRGSEITYARRYCLLAVTGVAPGGEDDDGQAAEAGDQPEQQQPAAKPRQQRTRPSRPTPAAPAEARSAPARGFNAAATQASQPTGPSPRPPAPPENTPAGSVTDAQLRAIWTLFGRVYGFGGDDHDKTRARGVCAHILNRPLEHTKDLSKTDAGTVIDTLHHWQDLADKAGCTPRAVLEDQMQAAAADGGE